MATRLLVHGLIFDNSLIVMIDWGGPASLDLGVDDFISFKNKRV